MGEVWRTPHNAAAALTTPTYDGGGQATHPDVIDFGSDAAGPSGKRYVMVLTPYPNADDQYENPSILHSSDGTTWTVPAGLTNPIDATPAGGYNADTDLVWDAAAGKLYLVYLGYDGTNKQVVVRESTDAVTWSAESVLWQTVVASNNPLSPTIIKDGSTWKLWYVEQVADPNGLYYREASTLAGLGAASDQACTKTGLESGRDIWHIDVFKAGGVYRMIVNDSIQNTNGTGGKVLLGSSLNGLAWTFGEPVMAAAGGSWDDGKLYRSTGQIDGSNLRLWYGGVSASNLWHIGYTTIPVSRFPVAA